MNMKRPAWNRHGGAFSCGVFPALADLHTDDPDANEVGPVSILKGRETPAPPAHWAD
jgi:hypothetical protein